MCMCVCVWGGGGEEKWGRGGKADCSRLLKFISKQVPPAPGFVTFPKIYHQFDFFSKFVFLVNTLNYSSSCFIFFCL